MVSAARRRRAWVLLLLTWAVIAGVLVARLVGRRSEEANRLDREAREQEALRQMDRLPPVQAEESAPDPAETPPEKPAEELPDKAP